jgi:hypothetical protein
MPWKIGLNYELTKTCFAYIMSSLDAIQSLIAGTLVPILILRRIMNEKIN